MWKRIVGAALIICMAFTALLLCPGLSGEDRKFDTDPDDVSEWSRVIAYVPLDDRVDNVESVIYMARASGYEIVMPEKSLYATKLDGQGNNEHGTKFGHRAALLEWVRDMDGRGCNIFILSLDQLLSGGLVNSRAASDSPIDWGKAGEISETQAFDDYVMALGNDENNRVYMFDSVMRLASTVGYGGLGMREYSALRRYGMVPRAQLTGESLNLPNIFAGYKYGQNGVTLAENTIEDESCRQTLTAAVIDSYTGARARKLRLLTHELKAIKNKTGFQMLVGMDDSSNDENIQDNELQYISGLLGDNARLLSGTDSLARLLVSSVGRDEYGCRVKTAVSFVGGRENLPASQYDRYPLTDTVALHLGLVNAVLVPENQAELQIVVLTSPEKQEMRQGYVGLLAAKLEEYQNANTPVIFIDASGGTYGVELEERLFQKVSFSRLLAYSGWYDIAGVTGCAVAMGFSRYMYLENCPEKSSECDKAHVSQLAHSMALSMAYVTGTKKAMESYITGMGFDCNNIRAGLWNRMLIDRKLNRVFSRQCQPILQNLDGGSVITGTGETAMATVTGIAFGRATLPWNRSFEVAFPITVEIDTQGENK